jgi:tRNA(fMet)-specific endonuclease VapC
MLSCLLDTNVCIRALRDRPAYIRERLKREAGSLCISTIVLYELYVGAEQSERPDSQRTAVTEFAAKLEVLDFDDNASRHAANIRAVLSAKGMIIGANDLLIAGHARSRSLTVITGNLGEFNRVDGLRCEDWLAA